MSEDEGRNVGKRLPWLLLGGAVLLIVLTTAYVVWWVSQRVTFIP